MLHDRGEGWSRTSATHNNSDWIACWLNYFFSLPLTPFENVWSLFYLVFSLYIPKHVYVFSFLYMNTLCLCLRHCLSSIILIFVSLIILVSLFFLFLVIFSFFIWNRINGSLIFRGQMLTSNQPICISRDREFLNPHLPLLFLSIFIWNKTVLTL